MCSCGYCSANNPICHRHCESAWKVAVWKCCFSSLDFIINDSLFCSLYSESMAYRTLDVSTHVYQGDNDYIFIPPVFIHFHAAANIWWWTRISTRAQLIFGGRVGWLLRQTMGITGVTVIVVATKTPFYAHGGFSMPLNSALDRESPANLQPLVQGA